MQMAGSPMFSSPFQGNAAFVVLPVRGETDYGLHPDEARILSSQACQKRRSEFASGRAAARLALKQLGFECPPPVLRGEGGEPRWPEGVVGSITHCDPWVVVAAARCSVASAIGIDLERVGAMHPDDIGDLICHDTELDWASRHPRYRERMVMAFSAKEAAFKAFYPLCGRVIDFKEVRLSWIPGQQRFLGELLATLAPHLKRGFEFQVGCQRSGDLVFTHLALSPSLEQRN